MEMLFEGISGEQLDQVKSTLETIGSNLGKVSKWCQENKEKSK